MEGGVVVQPQQRYFHPPRYPYGHRGRGIFVQQNFGYQFRNPSALASAQQPSAGNLTGTRARRAVHMRRTVDYYSSVICTLENRIWQRDHRDFRCVQPDFSYNSKVMFPAMHVEYPVQAVPSKNVRTSMNKQPCPIFCVAFTPEGRRLITGASSGEFTLWNGITFNFETILQAHDASVRAMVWSHNDLWMITADHGGFVKYWQTNMNNVKMFQAHKEAVRSLSFCPTDNKFASSSDDGTVRVWDFAHCTEEKILRGHGADVKCVDWHPQMGLVASGSKDTQQPVKLWDPKSGHSLATLHIHKGTVMNVSWNQNGNWLLSASRDHLIKLFDIRAMKELQTFRGHKKEACSLAWSPTHENVFASGGSVGDIVWWQVGSDKELGSVEMAHENMVWTLAWHPLGHILASGSNDHTTKFWNRPKPGDKLKERFNLEKLSSMDATDDSIAGADSETAAPVIPGMGLEHGIPEHLKEVKKPESMIPGLEWADFPRSVHIKKTPYAKPVPKQFEEAWQSATSINLVPNEVDTEMKKERQEMEKKRQPLLAKPSEKAVAGVHHDKRTRSRSPHRNENGLHSARDMDRSGPPPFLQSEMTLPANFTGNEMEREHFHQERDPKQSRPSLLGPPPDVSEQNMGSQEHWQHGQENHFEAGPEDFQNNFGNDNRKRPWNDGPGAQNSSPRLPRFSGPRGSRRGRSGHGPRGRGTRSSGFQRPHRRGRGRGY